MNKENHGHFLGSSGCRRLSLWEKYLFSLWFHLIMNAISAELKATVVYYWLGKKQESILSGKKNTQVSTFAFVFICYTILKKKCYKDHKYRDCYINYYITQKCISWH